MSLFQNIILKNFYKNIDEKKIKSAYEIFRTYFLNKEIQQNIFNCKEEEFQEGFLRELFVNVLGYTIKPCPNFNLIREQKNIDNSKKTDGAININGEIVGIIELKNHKTPNLKDVEAQAFGYKNHHRNTKYIITSNYEKLRFYIDNILDYEEFDLTRLTYSEFKLLWTCISYESISKDVPYKLKNESVGSEDRITKEFYKLYSNFRTVLFDNIVENNSKYDKLTLFKKSQKLLDRFLFVFFAEDKFLLPPKSIINIIKEWEKLKELDEYRPLYDRIKKFFGYIDTGYKNDKYNIFAYNGGLFKCDEILDSIIIDDNILLNYTRKLSDYDFETDVDVNILGHIFEHSLNTVDSIKKETNNNDETISKRKKDGVFYTPRFITKYIIDNTIGKLCSDKKIELSIKETDYIPKRHKETIKALDDKLTLYRNWLLNLTICDPACGSGAFLNATLDFLISEHKFIDELSAKILGHDFIFPDIENVILEQNLYGVDINEESVEIAKLSLWLRTAKPYRKLTSLNENIKCGNSLITYSSVVENRAFNWKAEFPKVFEQGGFDIVIGNPPYIQLQANGGVLAEQLKNEKYETFVRTGDIYCLFYERGLQILKQGGIEAYITSNKWMRAGYGKKLRDYLVRNNPLILINLGAEIFESATVDTNILIIQKSENKNNFIATSEINKTTYFDAINFIPMNIKIGEIWTIDSVIENKIKSKIEKIGTPLKEWNIDINRGILTGLNEAFIIDSAKRDELIRIDPKSDEIIKPILRGRDVNRYYNEWAGLWLINTHNGVKDKGIKPVDINNYPAIKKYLDNFSDKLQKRQDKGDTPYNLRNCAYLGDFYKEKIVFQEIVHQSSFYYDMNKFICADTARIITGDNLKYLISIFNSKLFFYGMKTYYCGGKLGEKGIRMKHTFMQNFPIVKLSDKRQKEYIDIVKEISELSENLKEVRHKLYRRLFDNFDKIRITKKLETFEVLTYKLFLKELSKQKIKLSLTQQDEWEDYFMINKDKCANLKIKIFNLDNILDKMIYKLYKLTYDEILLIDKDFTFSKIEYDK